MAGPSDDVVRGNWASDPWGRYPYRWFDGENWSALVFDGTTQYLDPFVTSIRPETAAAAPATASASTPATTQMPIVSQASTPAPIDTSSLSPWAPGASNGSASSAQSAGRAPIAPIAPAPAASGPAAVAGGTPAVATDRRPSTPSAGPASEQRFNPREVVTATTAARPVPVGALPAGGSSGSGGSTAKKRPVWVPVVGVIMVVAFSWWLYNLRGDDDEFASSTDTATEVSEPVAEPSSVTTTVAPATTLPIPETTAEVASLPPPVPDASATGLQDCIEFVPAAAFAQLPWAQELWVAAGSDAAGLPAVCAALPPEQLTDIALRRDEQELATTGSTSPAPTTVAPPAEAIAPPITSADGSTVPVSPTMPPPLPTTAP